MWEILANCKPNPCEKKKQTLGLNIIDKQIKLNPQKSTRTCHSEEFVIMLNEIDSIIMQNTQ